VSTHKARVIISKELYNEVDKQNIDKRFTYFRVLKDNFKCKQQIIRFIVFEAKPKSKISNPKAQEGKCCKEPGHLVKIPFF
jgi:hypothetical protein